MGESLFHSPFHPPLLSSNHPYPPSDLPGQPTFSLVFTVRAGRLWKGGVLVHHDDHYYLSNTVHAFHLPFPAPTPVIKSPPNTPCNPPGQPTFSLVFTVGAGRLWNGGVLVCLLTGCRGDGSPTGGLVVIAVVACVIAVVAVAASGLGEDP